MNKCTNIVAIDPGASGGVARIKLSENPIMPNLFEIYSMRNTTEDIITLVRVMGDCNVFGSNPHDTLFVIEDIPRFVTGSMSSPSSMAKLHYNYGVLSGAIEMLRSQYGAQVVKVTPRKWQNALNAGRKKDYGNHWKSHLQTMAINMCREDTRFSEANRRITLKTADAVLILMYALKFEREQLLKLNY